MCGLGWCFWWFLNDQIGISHLLKEIGNHNRCSLPDIFYTFMVFREVGTINQFEISKKKPDPEIVARSVANAMWFPEARNQIVTACYAGTLGLNAWCCEVCTW